MLSGIKSQCDCQEKKLIPADICPQDDLLFFFDLLQKPLRYRRAISYDSKEYYMRLLSGNPGMYQHSVEHTTEGETTQHEPEHGEDTIARVKGTETVSGKTRFGV